MTWVTSATSMPRAATSVAIEHVDVPALERGERALALVLGLVAVDRHRLDAAGAQALDEPVGAALGADEDEREVAVALELLDERLELGLVEDLDEAVLDLRGLLRGRLVRVAPRVARVLARQVAGGAGERGGEQQRLALGGVRETMRSRSGRKPMSIMRSASSRTRIRMRPRSMSPRCMRSSRRPGVATSRWARAGGLGLALDAHAAVDGGDGQAEGLGDVAGVVDDLAGELARRGEHERGGARVARASGARGSAGRRRASCRSRWATRRGRRGRPARRG